MSKIVFDIDDSTGALSLREIERVCTTMPSYSTLTIEASPTSVSQNLVKFGNVVAFDKVPSTHDEVRKLVEEASEVFAQYELYRCIEENENWWHKDKRNAKTKLMEEIADVIQVVANLLMSLGISDATGIINGCYIRNVARGRISCEMKGV